MERGGALHRDKTYFPNGPSQKVIRIERVTGDASKKIWLRNQPKIIGVNLEAHPMSLVHVTVTSICRAGGYMRHVLSAGYSQLSG